MFKPAVNLFHVIATVPDLDRTLKYYIEKLDFKLIMEARNFKALSSTGRILHVGVVERADNVFAMMEFTQFVNIQLESPPESPTYGLWAVTWEVKDLDTIYEEWVSRGVEFTQKPTTITVPNAGTFYSAFMKDIDGHMIELAQIVS